ncbi:hypothetical protein FACS189485_10410 [Spirochaetia bacterium]|nr:hypothetical protein FACS189485_10410 [Spirochaetia bacterium]
MHYGPYLKQFTEGRYKYYRKGGEGEVSGDLNYSDLSNGGDSGNVLNYVRKTPTALDCDVFLFNCGLHDIKGEVITGKLQVSLSDYQANLETVCSILTTHSLQPVWIRSTPVDDAQHTAFCKDFTRTNADLQNYNAAADKIMGDHNIPVIDLYSFTLSLGGSIYADHIHFTEDTRRIQAAYIAGFLNAIE